MSPMPGRAMSPVPATPVPHPMGPGHHASPLPGPYPDHRAPPRRSRASLFLVAGAVLVLAAAAIASIVLAASGG